MKVGIIGFGWGLGGVLALLLFAIYRLTPMAMELTGFSLSALQWLALAFSIICMAYMEGYKGFHKAFAPRVVVRAGYLRQHARAGTAVLAPLFCMGYIHATRRRQVLSYLLTLMIIVLVSIVRLLPQPWRGIVDAGVVTGLVLGVASILYYLVQSFHSPDRLDVSPEVPDQPPIDSSGTYR